MTESHDSVFRLLFVCTANQCRSPMAEVMARRMLEQRGADAVVASCGTMEGGVRASAGSVRAMLRKGLDLSTHLSHQLDVDTVGAATLIVTMERQHIASVAELSISAVNRTFTLPEIADLSTLVGPRRPPTTVQEWVERANRMRDPATIMTVSADSDVRDPMGGSKRDYRRTADQIEALLGTTLGAVFPIS